MLRHITVKGDHYSCGKQLGKILKKEIQRRLQQLSPVYSPKKYKNGLEKINKICSKYHPDLMKQLKGIAEGAEVDYWHLLFMNAPEFTEKTSGCTSIARVENYNAELFHKKE